MTSRRAATTRLEPGQPSIDRATPTWDEGRSAWLVRSSLHLPDARLIRSRSQATTKGELKRRARAEEQIAKAGHAGDWKSTSDVADYIDQISRPAVKRANDHPNTVRHYLKVLDWLLGRCPEHRRTRSRPSTPSPRAPGSASWRAACRKSRRCTSTRAHDRPARSCPSTCSPARPRRAAAGQLPARHERRPQARRETQPEPARAAARALTKEQWHAALDHLLGLDPIQSREQARRPVTCVPQEAGRSRARGT